MISHSRADGRSLNSLMGRLAASAMVCKHESAEAGDAVHSGAQRVRLYAVGQLSAYLQSVGAEGDAFHFHQRQHGERGPLLHHVQAFGGHGPDHLQFGAGEVDDQDLPAFMVDQSHAFAGERVGFPVEQGSVQRRPFSKNPRHFDSTPLTIGRRAITLVM